MRPCLEEMADMPLYAYSPPPSIVDHAHAREHQHQTYLQWLARRQPDERNFPNYPDCDIRDAISHYLIDVECPGVKDSVDIHCQWTSSRHLTVSGSVSRPEYVRESEDAFALMPMLCRESEIPAQAQEGAHKPPYVIVGERRIGSFRRNFTFPVEIEQQQMTARLEAGLLRIKLPKMQHHVPKGSGKVDIEVVE